MKALMDDRDQTLKLVAEAKRGNREAFDRLAALFQGRVRASVEGWTKFQVGPRVEIEEVLQETLVRAFRSLDRFQWEGEDSFFRWLCGIAKHALAQAIQDERKKREAGKAPEAADPGPSRSKVLRQEERMDRLEQALKKLTPEYRQVIQLARIDGLTTREIAERMERSPNAVKHLLARALRRLRDEFGDTESLHLPRDRRLRDGWDDDVR
jgi:RNA polymerase sigma-70 factor (ECF subfamily)